MSLPLPLSLSLVLKYKVYIDVDPKAVYFNWLDRLSQHLIGCRLFSGAFSEREGTLALGSQEIEPNNATAGHMSSLFNAVISVNTSRVLKLVGEFGCRPISIYIMWALLTCSPIFVVLLA